MELIIIHFRPTVVLWEGRYISPHQLYQVRKHKNIRCGSKNRQSWELEKFRHFKCSTCSSRDLKSLKQNLMEKENRSYTVYYPQNHLSKSGPQICCIFFIVFVFVFVFLLDPVEHSQHFSSYFYFPLHNFPKLLRNNYSNLWLYLILAFYRTSQRIMSASEKNIALCVLQIGKTI